MEYIDLYDQFMNPLHKTVSREEVRKQEEFFFIVHVWIRNSDGQYLIQKRNKNTDFEPYMWATTMGIVETSKTTVEAALQEVKEELGLSYNERDLSIIARYKTQSEYANHFTDVFLIEDNVELGDVVMQESEVKEVKYVSKETLYDMINGGTFWDYKKMLLVSDYFTDLEKSE